MNLQRRSLFAIVSGSIISLFGQGALAATGPLVKPKRLGQVIIFRNKKYTAIKKGKLLVWDKGVAIKAAASASPTASATTIATPKPSATATAASLTFVAKSSDIADAQTVVLVVKPASSASFSVAVTKVGSAITVVSATCTHRGCIVEAAGNQLGCQCHGSAFNPNTGAVIQGPAISPLKKYEVSEDAGSIYIKI
jgi:Rieske Fe-S protein